MRRLFGLDTKSILHVCGADIEPWQICGMLAHEFSDTEAPTNPIGPRPLASPPVTSRRTHLLLVGTPRLPGRGQAWSERHPDADFDGVTLQRLLTLERLSLG